MTTEETMLFQDMDMLTVMMNLLLVFVVLVSAIYIAYFKALYFVAVTTLRLFASLALKHQFMVMIFFGTILALPYMIKWWLCWDNVVDLYWSGVDYAAWIKKGCGDCSIVFPTIAVRFAMMIPEQCTLPALQQTLMPHTMMNPLTALFREGLHIGGLLLKMGESAMVSMTGFANRVYESLVWINTTALPALALAVCLAFADACEKLADLIGYCYTWFTVTALPFICRACRLVADKVCLACALVCSMIATLFGFLKRQLLQCHAWIMATALPKFCWACLLVAEKLRLGMAFIARLFLFVGFLLVAGVKNVAEMYWLHSGRGAHWMRTTGMVWGFNACVRCHGGVVTFGGMVLTIVSAVSKSIIRSMKKERQEEAAKKSRPPHHRQVIPPRYQKGSTVLYRGRGDERVARVVFAEAGLDGDKPFYQIRLDGGGCERQTTEEFLFDRPRGWALFSKDDEVVYRKNGGPTRKCRIVKVHMAVYKDEIMPFYDILKQMEDGTLEQETLNTVEEYLDWERRVN